MNKIDHRQDRKIKVSQKHIQVFCMLNILKYETASLKSYIISSSSDVFCANDISFNYPRTIFFYASYSTKVSFQVRENRIDTLLNAFLNAGIGNNEYTSIRYYNTILIKSLRRLLLQGISIDSCIQFT